MLCLKEINSIGNGFLICMQQTFLKMVKSSYLFFIILTSDWGRFLEACIRINVVFSMNNSVSNLLHFSEY